MRFTCAARSANDVLRHDANAARAAATARSSSARPAAGQRAKTWPSAGLIDVEMRVALDELAADQQREVGIVSLTLSARFAMALFRIRGGKSLC